MYTLSRIINLSIEIQIVQCRSCKEWVNIILFDDRNETSFYGNFWNCTNIHVEIYARIWDAATKNGIVTFVHCNCAIVSCSSRTISESPLLWTIKWISLPLQFRTPWYTCRHGDCWLNTCFISNSWFDIIRYLATHTGWDYNTCR